MVAQGDVFWVDTGEPYGSSPGYVRPFVIVQNNLFNKSRIATAVACGLTSNLGRAMNPGNVLLDPGEANLPRQSVVNVSQIFTFDKDKLQDRIGTLSSERVREILRGINLLLEPRDVRGLALQRD
jgi:mRNA interferase MazF